MNQRPSLEALKRLCTQLRLHVVNTFAPSVQGYVQQSLGSSVAETPMDHGIGQPFRRIGRINTFCEGETTPYLMRRFGPDHGGKYGASEGVVERKRHKNQQGMFGHKLIYG